MSFWNYIGEFFLFRWLFDKLQSKDGSNSYHHDYSSHNSYADNDYERKDQSFNDFHEEQDDYDMMDDF